MIQLTWENDQPVYVNEDQITHVLSHNNGFTLVNMVSFGPIFVKEKAEEVLAKIDNQNKVESSSIFDWFKKKGMV